MSVVSVREANQETGASKSDAGVSVTRAFIVVVDDPLDGVEVVRFAIDPVNTLIRIPSITDAHPGNAFLSCTGIDPRPIGNDPYNWIVIVRYDSIAVSDSVSRNDIPFLRPVVQSWGSVQASESIVCEVNNDGDLSNTLMVNSAGDPFDPPLTRTLSFPTWTIERNERTFNGALTKQLYENRINSIAWLGWPPRTALLQSISAREAWEGRNHFWVVTYTFYLKPSTWGERVLDRGSRELVDGKLVNWRDPVTGTPGITLLDGAGRALTPGSASKWVPGNPDNPPVNPNSDFYQVFGLADFNELRVLTTPYP